MLTFNFSYPRCGAFVLVLVLSFIVKKNFQTEIMASKPVFAYWNIRGLGNPIRFLLAYLEVDYDEKRYDAAAPAEWFDGDKPKLKLGFPNLPYLLDGSANVTESRAIMKHLCRTRKPEMLGKTAAVQTDIDTVDNVMYDLFYIGFIGVIYEFSEEKHNEYKKSEPVKLGYVNNFLNGKQWVGGEDLSYVDFFVYEVLQDLRVYDAKCLDNFANLQGYLERFESIPAIKKYMDSPAFIKTPLFTPEAVIKI